MLEVFGAEIILTPGRGGLATAPCAGRRRWPSEHPEWCFLYQYGNDANPRAHYEGTGPEIWRDCPEITHFVAGLGTSGTLMGTGTVPQGAEPGHQGHRHRAAARRAGRGAAQPRRGLHPAGVRAVGRLRAARPQAGRAAAGVARVDPPPGRASAACSPASPPARRWPARSRWPSEIDEGVIVFIVVRRRLEVPVDRRLHRRPRRRRGQRREDHLLLDLRRRRRCASAGSYSLRSAMRRAALRCAGSARPDAPAALAPFTVRRVVTAMAWRRFADAFGGAILSRAQRRS